MEAHKGEKRLENQFLREELNIDKEKLKALKKKLAKVEQRSEKGTETLFRLVSKNQYTLNSMIDRKSNILISVNALILSIVIGTVLSELDQDPHLLLPSIIILGTNLTSIAFAIFATRPELFHGDKKTNNLMFYGNFHAMEESEYTEKLTDLIYQGDELYKIIAKDTFYLGKTMSRKFKLLRKSFDAFLIGIIISVIVFVGCHILFGSF
ncbi:Pycsar system effector family protein [Spongiimicrobium salis]|uniref:Pycsar system effector family protein n=1 Tax=Spongiimicrobium salis TaxID=1667022 RepID=UPI00374DD764